MLNVDQSLVQNQNFKDTLDFKTGTEDKREEILSKLKDDKYTLSFDLSLNMSDAGINAAETADFKVLSFGIMYGSTLENLEDFAFYKKHAFQYENGVLTTDAAAAAANAKLLTDGKKVVEYQYAANATGLQNLYANNTYHVYNTAPLKARYALLFVRYTVDGLVYEEYSTVAATSTLLGDTTNIENGYITGVGDTLDMGVEMLQS